MKENVAVQVILYGILIVATVIFTLANFILAPFYLSYLLKKSGASLLIIIPVALIIYSLVFSVNLARFKYVLFMDHRIIFAGILFLAVAISFFLKNSTLLQPFIYAVAAIALILQFVAFDFSGTQAYTRNLIQAKGSNLSPIENIDGHIKSDKDLEKTFALFLKDSMDPKKMPVEECRSILEWFQKEKNNIYTMDIVVNSFLASGPDTACEKKSETDYACRSFTTKIYSGEAKGLRDTWVLTFKINAEDKIDFISLEWKPQ